MEAAAIILREDDKKILLIKRAEKPFDIWSYVAGKIDDGEKAWEAALREIKEETGLVPFV